MMIHNKPSPITISSKTLASNYRTKAVEAYKNRHIFTIFGEYNTIRNSLLKRGWLEKLTPARHHKLQNLSDEVLLMHAKKGNEYEAVLISKIMNHFPAFFIWQPKEQRDLYMNVRPYRNRLRIAHCLDFSTKAGLIACAEQQHWFRQDGVSALVHPRFFRMGASQEERLAFINEYQITQCCSLLRFLRQYFCKHEEIIDYENGTISAKTMQFALRRLKQQFDDCDSYNLLDIEESQIPEEEWTIFFENSNKVINNRQKIKCTYKELDEFTKESNRILTKIEEKCPDLKWDGYKNLWILKPGYLNRGRGIVIRKNLNEILEWCTIHSNYRYIVQKYIEQPLLIYRTKFDIRQYMLISVRESTVQMWLYTDCYLRFSSQEYTTDDFDESIHLTNNCVQRKYKNKANRDARLPKNNMWTLNQFKDYLKTQNIPVETWENRTFAGFRENLIAAVLPSLDETNLIENSFELFGCDFMLDEQCNPILIEINSTPDLSASTNITARICPMVMQDCLKVILDLPRNSHAQTGLFKKVYEVNYKFKQDLNKIEDLSVSGKSMILCNSVYENGSKKFAKKPKFLKKSKKDVV